MVDAAFPFEALIRDSGLSADQRALLSSLTATLRAVRPPDLDLERTVASTQDGELGVMIAHRGQDELAIVVEMPAADAPVQKSVVVCAGAQFDHLADDPEGGRAWPMDADDHIEAAVALVRALLLGRVVVEVRRGLLGRRVRSYIVADDGQRELIGREWWLWPRPRRPVSSEVRVHFGPVGDGGHEPS